MPAPLVCFRREGTGGALERSPEMGQDEGAGRALACVRCQQLVTTHAARIEVAGAHEHTFANPAGFRYHIGCFARASCVAAGERSDHWSWFPPHTWQIEHCATCGEHLGWLFRAETGSFHGLILDRLVEVNDDGT